MSKQSPHDSLYAAAQGKIVDFAFDEAVANVFPDMIRRSVPGYENIVTLIGLLAEQYARPDTNVYDLGCSLGAATLSMRARIADDCRIIGVDNAEAMIDSCRNNIEQGGYPNIELQCADIQDVGIENASVVVLNFVLQFIAPEQRLAIVQNIYNGLQPGGVLILSEKLGYSDPQEHAFQERMQLAFKRANGYSDLEISQKRTALEKVLIPDSYEQHRQRLQEAGFKQVFKWFQAFNFASILAIKEE